MNNGNKATVPKKQTDPAVESFSPWYRVQSPECPCLYLYKECAILGVQSKF